MPAALSDQTPFTHSRYWAADNLAARLLAGPWTHAAIADAIDSLFGIVHDSARWALVNELAALAEGTYTPSPQALTAHLFRSQVFKPPRGEVAAVLDAPRFAPIQPFNRLTIPKLATLGELAQWLGEPIEQVEWLADERRGHGGTANAALRHYHYTFLRKRRGQLRLVEAPKSRLKAIQRRILHEILAKVPVHPAAHGFVAGRSCRSGAQLHAGEAMVATFDLAEFFPSIGLPRIRGIFRSLGYPWAVARRLAGLCTTVTPPGVFQSWPEALRPSWAVSKLYAVPHLPQGAPTSPTLANLLAWRLDRRLHGLARAIGANYSRYADDLAFSGDAAFAKHLGRFGAAVGSIAQEEGFALNAAKTRTMPRSTCQRVTGIVVNEHCNVSRADFDLLKAILHNCIRTGPAEQNRAEVADFRRYLEGRIAWVAQINPRRAIKLWQLFDQIAWHSAASR